MRGLPIAAVYESSFFIGGNADAWRRAGKVGSITCCGGPFKKNMFSWVHLSLWKARGLWGEKLPIAAVYKSLFFIDGNDDSGWCAGESGSHRLLLRPFQKNMFCHWKDRFGPWKWGRRQRQHSVGGEKNVFVAKLRTSRRPLRRWRVSGYDAVGSIPKIRRPS